MPRYITMERRRVCPVEEVGTDPCGASARQPKNCDAEGQAPGQPPRQALGPSQEVHYARQRDRRLRRESFILDAPRKVEYVAWARQCPAPAAAQI